MDLRFTHISFGEGPSHSRVSDIIEDNQGFLWFGTQGGLRRYDGYRTREYHHDPKNPNSIGGNFIFCLLKDHTGKIWVASSAGLDRFDPATEIFIHYKNLSSGEQVVHINEDRDGTIWLATDSGLFRFDPASGLIARYQQVPGDEASLSSNHLSSTFEQKDGTFWVAMAGSLDVFDRKTGRVIQHVPLDVRFSPYLAGPIRLYEDHSGVLWVAFPGGNGLGVIDRRLGKVAYYSFAKATSEYSLITGVRTILEDEDGVLWLGTQSNGLLKLDRERKAFVRYRNDPTNPDSLSANRVDALYEDHEGGIWVGTTGGGVNRVARSPSPFRRYPFEACNAQGPNTLATVYEDRHGLLWIATVSALLRIDRKTGHCRSYRIAGGPGQASSTWVTSITGDAYGHSWFGTRGGGLRRYDERGGTFKVYRHNPADPQSLPSDFVSVVLADSKGTLWVGTGDDLAALNPGEQHFRPYRATGPVRAIAEGRDGSIWLAIWNSGLWRLDPASGQFTNYRQDPGTAGSLISNQANALYIDHSGTLWVGTLDGLARFDPVTHTFRTYREQDGLPNNYVNGILEDESGNLWLSTNNGLSRFNPGTNTFTNYSVADGLPGNEFYGANAGFKSSTGEMFFCSLTGLTTFFPQKVVDNLYMPPVMLTDFQLFSRPVAIGGDSPLKQAIWASLSLTLTHAQSVFSFEFSALSFASPERNHYRYRLEGLESKWNETDSTRRFVTYTTLAPAEYVFRVQGSNNRGVWNEKGVSLHIRILPPWWGTWWFRVLCSAACVTLLWAAYQVRTRQLQEQEKKFREAVETMPALAFIARPDGYRTFVNRRWAEYTGFTVEQATGFGWEAAVHPDDLKKIIDIRRKLAARGEPVEYEMRLRRGADGEYRWFQVRAAHLCDRRGKVVRWFGVALDIEDRKRAEQLQAELAHTNRVSLLGELAASISHELRQPITATMINARTSLRWLDRDQPELEKARGTIGRIVQDGARATEIIDRLRSLYKKTPPQRELIDVNEVIREMVVLLRGEATRFAVSIRTDLTADLPKVTADRVQVQQVLMNLMLNGIEAMNETGGTLTVKSQQGQSGEVLISVSDTGVGLPADKADQIFNAFFTTKPQGSGMGLAISRSIVESHGGRLWATPNDGRGATFSFTLLCEMETHHTRI